MLFRSRSTSSQHVDGTHLQSDQNLSVDKSGRRLFINAPFHGWTPVFVNIFIGTGLMSVAILLKSRRNAVSKANRSWYLLDWAPTSHLSINMAISHQHIHGGSPCYTVLEPLCGTPCCRVIQKTSGEEHPRNERKIIAHIHLDAGHTFSGVGRRRVT